MSRYRILTLLLWIATPILMAFGGPQPFHVAPLRPSGSNFAPGDWVESTKISQKDEVTVIVMTSWCGHCAKLIDQIAASSNGSRVVDMILFFESEYGDSIRQQIRGKMVSEEKGSALISKADETGQHLVKPERLAGKQLPFYFVKRSEFEGLVRTYPTVLSCTRSVCTAKSQSTLGLR